MPPSIRVPGDEAHPGRRRSRAVRRGSVARADRLGATGGAHYVITVTHFITLSALDVVSLSHSLTEPLIALTVVAIGVENILDTRWRAADAAVVGEMRAARNYRWLVTFCFGLVHGIGLGYVLPALPGLAGLGWFMERVLA